MLGEGLDVGEGGARLVEVGGEDQRVGCLADELLLVRQELRRTEVLEGLHDTSVGLRAISGHDAHVIVTLGAICSRPVTSVTPTALGDRSGITEGHPQLEPGRPGGTLAPMTDETRNENTTDQPDDDRTGPTEKLPGGDDEPRTEPPPAAEPKRLTRSGKDAVIGGVGSGLGRYFGVDPLLFRIGFVVLTFAGGFGVLAYLLLLAFMPTDGSEKPGGTSKVAAIAGAVVLGVALVTFLGTPFFFFGPGLLVLAVVGLAGVLLWRALEGGQGGDPARTAGRVFLAALLAIAVAGAALGVGIVAALGGGVVIASLAVLAGLVLIGTAFVGGARWLIVPALALVLPLGIVAAADIDLDGGVGDREYHPASAAELRDRYEIGIGSIDVDLTGVDLPAGRTDLGIDVGMG